MLDIVGCGSIVFMCSDGVVEVVNGVEVMVMVVMVVMVREREWVI